MSLYNNSFTRYLSCTLIMFFKWHRTEYLRTDHWQLVCA